MPLFNKIPVLIFLVFSNGFAQSNDKLMCNAKISEASTLYENGKFNEAIALLEPCIQSGNLTENKADVHRIIGLCYQALNNDVKAEEAIKQLLHVNPNYQLFPLNDPKEFTNLVNKFTIESKLFLGLNAGFNLSLPVINKPYSIKPATLGIQSKVSQFIGIYGDYYFKGKTFAINAVVNSGSLAFKQEVNFNDKENIDYQEELKQVDIGAEFKYYYFNNAKLKLYAGLGINVLFLRNANSNIVYNNTYTGTKIQSSRNMIADGSVKSTLYNGIADIGINTITSKGNLGFGLQYVYALTLVNNPDNRYNNIEYSLANQWLDSDIKINYLNVYLSYSFPLLWRVYK